MVINFIQKTSDRLILYTQNILEKKFWALRITLISITLSFFTAFPSYDIFFKNYEGNKHHWHGIATQIDRPLNAKKYSVNHHDSNIIFRISVPVIANIFGLQNKDLLLQIIFGLTLQIIALFIFFYSLAFLFFDIVHDKVSASFFTISFALIYPGNSLPGDIWGNMDVVAYCFLALSLLSKKPLLIFSFTLLASYTDERALIASCFVFLWHSLRNKDILNYNLKNIFHLNTASLAVTCSWLAYFIIRFILIKYYGFETNVVTAQIAPIVIKEAASNIPFGIWSGLEGIWLVIILASTILAMQKKWMTAILLSAGILIVTFVAFSVLDITRSIAYVFPAAILSFLIVSKTETLKNIRYTSLIIAVICLFPTYYVDGQNTSQWLYPLPLQVLRMITESETFSLAF